MHAGVRLFKYYCDYILLIRCILFPRKTLSIGYIFIVHGMHTWSSDENSVCPSACLSNECIVTKRKKICPDFYTIQKITYPSFLRRRMVSGGDLFYQNFGSTGPRWSEITDFELIFARSASAITPSGKSSINTINQFQTRQTLLSGDLFSTARLPC